MARSCKSGVVYMGVGSHVVAIQATPGGELFCLDASSGQIVWHNKLTGLGLGIVAFTGSAESVAQAAAMAAQVAATAAATV